MWFTALVNFFICGFSVDQNPELLSNSPTALGLPESDLMLNAFDGFLIYIESNGGIIFASEACKFHLGIPQVWLN